MTVDERLLSARLDELADRLPERFAEAAALAVLIRSGRDQDVVRINPVRFAGEHDLDEAAVVELFLHARKVGLLRMEWQYVCPGCGDIIESFQSLTSATAHYFCQICTADRDADLSDFVEITFSVAKDVRESSYHDPWSLSPDDYFFGYRFTANGFMSDGTPIREHLRDRVAVIRVRGAGRDTRVRVQRRARLSLLHERAGADGDRRALGGDAAHRLRVHRASRRELRG